MQGYPTFSTMMSVIPKFLMTLRMDKVELLFGNF